MLEAVFLAESGSNPFAHDGKPSLLPIQHRDVGEHAPGFKSGMPEKFQAGLIVGENKTQQGLYAILRRMGDAMLKDRLSQSFSPPGLIQLNADLNGGIVGRSSVKRLEAGPAYCFARGIFYHPKRPPGGNMFIKPLLPAGYGYRLCIRCYKPGGDGGIIYGYDSAKVFLGGISEYKFGHVVYLTAGRTWGVKLMRFMAKTPGPGGRPVKGLITITVANMVKKEGSEEVQPAGRYSVPAS